MNLKHKGRAAIASGAGLLAMAGVVLSGTAANATAYNGSWQIINAALVGTHNTSMYYTNSAGKVSTCVSVTSTHGTSGGEWTFQETWYNSGHPKVLYQSSDHEGTAKVCAPVKSLAPNNRVYDHIVLENPGPNLAVSASGTYTINNY